MTLEGGSMTSRGRQHDFGGRHSYFRGRHDIFRASPCILRVYYDQGVKPFKTAPSSAFGGVGCRFSIG